MNRVSTRIENLGFLLIGRMLPRFTQLKRYKRFDGFIMLVWSKGSIFHIDAGSHPVQEAGGGDTK